jgi:hypothetical protein
MFAVLLLPTSTAQIDTAIGGEGRNYFNVLDTKAHYATAEAT